jgi:hypothetical protein
MGDFGERDRPFNERKCVLKRQTKIICKIALNLK